MIAIVDYGMGNIHSVYKALQLYKAETKVTGQPQEILTSDKLVLPGVGAFADAMLELTKRGLLSPITEHIVKKKPFLGVCLGMQLLFEKSEEANQDKGLGILKGSVKRFAPKVRLKVPHMGWNQLKISSKACPILKDIPNNSYVYFCHSYYPEPEDKEAIAATTEYGVDFASVVWQENVFGMQFHPEKSQSIGLKILKNFVDL